MKKTKVEFPPKQSVFTYLEDYDKNPPTWHSLKSPNDLYFLNGKTKRHYLFNVNGYFVVTKPYKS
jgi:hypothetical protein